MVYEIVAGRSPKAKKKFGTVGTILLGKQYVKMERTMSLANPVYLDVSGPHVMLVSGKRGSGKSYTLGVIAEGLARIDPEIAENISTLIFDTLGIFWTMKYPNYRDDALLEEWELRPDKLNPMIYVPFGLFSSYQEKGVPVDVPFAIRPYEISGESWAEMFNLNIASAEGTLIERALNAAKEKNENPDIIDIVEAVKKDARSTDHEKNIIENRFLEAKKWGLFSPKGTEIKDLFKGGQTAILDLSAYSQLEGGQRIKSLVIGLIAKKILEQRMAARKAEEVKLISEGGFIFEKQAALVEKKAPLVWIMIDEAHEFIPEESRPQTLASRPLIQLLREGRQPGISVILATQQPGKIHSDVMTQSDIILSHRVTAKIDINALNQISSTYLPEALQKYIDELPAEKGTAILIDDKLEKIYPMRVRPRLSWHGGEDPTAIKSTLAQFKLV